MKDIRQRRLQSLIELSKQESWKAYAWNRAQELEKDQSGLWSGIATELKAAMLGLKQEREKAGASNADSKTPIP